MSKTNKTLIQFNAKNGKFKVGDGEIMPLTWLTKISLDKSVASSVIYGDGEVALMLEKDRGFTGVIGTTARDFEFEQANGLQMKLATGQAEIERNIAPLNQLYFETDFVKNKKEMVKKVWLFNVTVSAPNESVEQDTDTINPTTVEYAMRINGAYLKTAEGTSDFINPETGKKVKVWRLSTTPEDSNFSNFEASVPVPTMATEQSE